jgi:chromosome segregation ATPase
VLVTRDHDGAVHAYEPLSSGGDRRGLIRLAYTVPTDRVGRSTAFSLRLPDGYQIELPKPTPGENRAELENGQAATRVQPEALSPADDGAADRVADLERELGTLRSSDGELQRRLSELTAEHERTEAAAVHAEQALDTAHAERDRAVETAREAGSERAQLVARLRQLQARIELIRAESSTARTGTDPRLRQLESEREQLTTHVQALAELLSISEPTGDPAEVPATAEQLVTRPPSAADQLETPPAPSDADRPETLRAHAVREANEQAERELRQLRAGSRI